MTDIINQNTSVSDEEVAAFRTFCEENNARVAAEEEVKAQAESKRITLLSTPITPQPITGDTVEEVKASADASVADLAQQMQDRLYLLTDS